MEVTTCVPLEARKQLCLGTVDWEDDTIKIALFAGQSHGLSTSAYLATGESSGTGYSRLTVGSKTTTVDSSAGVVYLDCADQTWSSSTITADSCMLYDDTHSSDVALGIFDLGGSKSSSSGNFQIIMPTASATTGLIRLA